MQRCKVLANWRNIDHQCSVKCLQQLNNMLYLCQKLEQNSKRSLENIQKQNTVYNLHIQIRIEKNYETMKLNKLIGTSVT